MERRVMHRGGLLLAGALVLSLGRVAGAETTLTNDGFGTGGTAGFQSGFVTGEAAASRFVPEAPTQLLRIQFLFGGGGDATPRNVTIHVWDDAAGTDDPGSELYVNEFTVTPSDEALQEVDPTDGGAIDVTGPFRVGIEFQAGGLPSVARDDDGLDYPERNFIDASGMGWVRSQALGLEGDWIIRAVVATPAGADADADGDADADAGADSSAEADSSVEADADGEATGDGGGEGDAAPGCTSNTECPEAQYCGDGGTCTFDCRTSADCPGGEMSCNSLGQCVPSASGGGCTCRATPGAGGAGLMVVAFAVLGWTARRRRGSQR
ncbi:MAG: hypothetical protein HY905_11495 [Deltaproteobacteria bacterium]|nr:hypothetical protein [Deltaproteobacteria bacterium]